ncbi:putative Mannosyltransferase (PIG V) [Trypanosoma vivax]|uniref:GPI mannosyltransferase 2 n=1 Tax=Trypanosoma vivax (strain Y486) TaxID=1055687 RepID=G0U469_TRYVY|nr:hypothetical protein TRVL_04586 [Trypanosoma vivax]KAH8611807.1 putative Mannosyltransferase (PIG V) [Trypanosoma vivax]CCC52231.1 conserved hypothetical protein [Trypanosoma vivax Y486]
MANEALTGPLIRNDILLQIAQCSEMKLFLLVSGCRILLLFVMLLLRCVLQLILGAEALWDSGTLLYDDNESTWTLLNFPRNWDGVHFFHIATHGYSHENLCAFFPLVPLIVRAVSWVMECGFLSEAMRVTPVSFHVAVLNVLVGGAAAVLLRRITALTLLNGTLMDELPPSPICCQQNTSMCESAKVAPWREVGAAVLMWMLSPASVFTVVLYTESIFSFLTFLALYLLAISPKGRRRAALAEAGAVVSFFLAGCARSNATLYTGFVLYPIFMQLFLYDTYRRRYKQRYGDAANPSRWPSIARCVITLIEGALIITPFLAMNGFCYNRFVPLWNTESKAEIGSRFWTFYSWMQKRYWNVGFLNAYRWSNVPNMLISAPIVFFTVRGLVLFFSKPVMVKRKEQKNWDGVCLSVIKGMLACTMQSSNIAYLVVTIVIGVTVVHINVVNRFIMSSPCLYWIWGRQLVCDPRGRFTVAMLCIFVVWNCLGALFVPHGMPWT